MDLPFEDNVFDCATVGWGLRNVPDILKVNCEEMVRVVKPGGKVVSLDGPAGDTGFQGVLLDVFQQGNSRNG